MKSDLENLIETSTNKINVTEDGDHDKFSHWVERDEAFKGLVEGKPVVALCGKIWIPSGDPSQYPICPTCDGILKQFFLPIGDLP